MDFLKPKKTGKKKKKILILFSTLGGGHVSASKAIEQALDKLYPDKYEIKLLDYFALLSDSLNKSLQKLYDNSVKFAPMFYKTFFDFFDTKWQLQLVSKLNSPFIAAPIKKELIKEEADLLISTHPMWDYVLAEIWHKKKPHAPLITVILDSITIHKIWLLSKANYRVVPNEDSAKILIKKEGIDAKNIKTFGFPVDLQFTEKTDKAKVLKSLGLNPKLFTILVFATMENYKKSQVLFEKIIFEKRDYNVIAICGRNEELYDKIQYLKKEKNVKILNWTTQAPDIIKASDLVITKAGGATVMECIASLKPMIITQVIPGQEEGNAEFIDKHKLGVLLPKNSKGLKKLPLIISNIRKNYDKYKNSLKKHSKPDAALKVAKLADQML
jgi:UDP-N-acetylglucosamine:LPS N-acetylglucosamine transferase